jgi:hypothetical protein
MIVYVLCKESCNLGGVQDGRKLRGAEILSSMISEKYLRIMVARIR